MVADFRDIAGNVIYFCLGAFGSSIMAMRFTRSPILSRAHTMAKSELRTKKHCTDGT